MRPASIVMFERLYLGSLALGVVGMIMDFDTALTEFTREPGMEQLGLGAGFLGGLMAIGVGISLLLWWFIAHKASRVAKWILVVLTAVGLISLPGMLAGPWDAATVIGLASYALTIAAIAYLFTDDAKAWFRGETRADATAFD